MRQRNIISNALLLSLLFVAFDNLPLLAQEKQKTKVTIIMETYDEHGNKTVEKIVKEGAEADAIDLDNLGNGLSEQRSFEFRNFGDLQEMPGFDGWEPFEGQGFDQFRSFFDSLGFKGFGFFGDGFGNEEDWSPFGQFEESNVKPKLGVRINNLESEAGVLVTHVMDDTPAARAGIKEGDVILAIDDHSIATSQELVDYVQGLQPEDEVNIDIRRDGDHIQVVAKMTEYKPKKDIEIRKI